MIRRNFYVGLTLLINKINFRAFSVTLIRHDPYETVYVHILAFSLLRSRFSRTFRTAFRRSQNFSLNGIVVTAEYVHDFDEHE